MRKGRKVTKHCVFPVFCGSGGLKSRLAKTAGAEPAGQMKDKKIEVKMYKTHHVRTTFGSRDVEKVHAVVKCRKHFSFGPLLEVEMSKKCTPLVARSTFGSENVKITTCSGHLWMSSPDVVQKSKKCTPLWHEAHVQVKSVKEWWL